METLITPEQKKQIERFYGDVVSGLVKKLSVGKKPAQIFLSRGKEVRKVIEQDFNKLIAQFSGDPIAEWTQFYREFLGLTVDLSGVKIPEYRNGLDWIDIVAQELLVVSKGRPHDFIITAMRQKGLPYWTVYDNLDEVLSPGISIIENDQRRNDRWPDKGSYATRSRNRDEADEENKNLSADDLLRQGILGSTCLEYLLRVSKYYFQTKKYLDIKNWTLLSGSRYSNGCVPYADFSVGKVRVFGCDSSDSGACLCARLTAV